MMLCKLSIKNIIKSFKDYAIYFFTLILGVSIFYVFNAINDQTVMLNINARTYEIIKLLNNMLSGVSIFVAFILGFLIIYASRFLMKRRYKEFGIYLTLGISKRKISLILFIETIIIGIISLVVGLCVGFFLSQFMSLLVANMFEADLTKYTFIISKDAIIKTIVYFAIMYLFVMLFNTVNVSKCKLIDLIHSNKKSEKVKIKNPAVCIIMFIVSTILLGYAYYKVAFDFKSIKNFNDIYLYMGIGFITTFTIIWSLSGFILKIVMSLKNIYYKNINSFTLRQISSKVNTTVISCTFICLMLFVTICILSSALSLKYSMTSNLKKLIPVDLEFSKTVGYSEEEKINYGYTDEAIEDGKYSVEETIKKIYKKDLNLKDKLNINLYQDNDLTLEKTLGNETKKIKKQFPYVRLDSNEEIITISEYNKLSKLYKNKSYSLKENEYMIIADYDSMIGIRNNSLKANTKITVNGNELSPKYSECKDGFINLAANHINMGVIVVPDNVVNKSMVKKKLLFANYKITDKDKINKIENSFISAIENNYNKTTLLSFDSRNEITNSSVGLGGIVTFLALYLGIIFLMASAAVLALKELSDANDNKMKFNMLRKIGVDEKMINNALFKQILIFFMFPLVLAIVHSVFGIIFANHILETFGSKKLLSSIIMTSIFLIIIYGGYFIITYLCSKNIIKERN